MLVALVSALIVAVAAPGSQPAQSGWQRFDTRPNGFGDSDFLYNSYSRRQTGNVATAWVTYDFHYSGRNDTTHIELWEIDCRRMRSRVPIALTLDGERFTGPARRVSKFAAISAGSADAALAARICRK